MLSVCAMTSVRPSGLARAVASSARLPPAPGLFSTTIFQPVSWPMAVAIMRVSVSVPPPGGNGEMKVMGAAPRPDAPAAAAHDASMAAAIIFFNTCIVCLAYKNKVPQRRGRNLVLPGQRRQPRQPRLHGVGHIERRPAVCGARCLDALRRAREQALDPIEHQRLQARQRQLLA